ncbi:MAG: ubiquinol-cytochrome c reductase iron-sulfur subunit [Isosphaeraceae bacterium]
MAKRPSVQEILAAARKGGAAKPEAENEPKAAPEPAVELESQVESSAAAVPALPQAPPAPPANVPTPSSLGRPLSLKEKLAAARAGGAPAAAAPQAAITEASAAAEAAPAQAAAPPPAAPLGRPMTLQEKLAAARGPSTAATAPAAGAAKPAEAKPAAAAAAKAGAARVLPPLEKITDPRDLAEALRQTGAKKAKESAAKKAEAAPAKPAPAAKAAAPAKPQTVLPKPSKAAAPAAQSSRRGFMVGGVLVSWIAVAWVTFTAGVAALTAMCGRFMFPNVLAEPPSTIKVGTLKDYEPEYVSERYKAEAGFWIVRSTRYNGQDIIYALSTVCTHLGCPPNWLTNEQKFKCPCHGSGYYITGVNFEGPAPRPLERFKVTLADDGQIQVDKSQKFQQELGQWSDPDSYIAAV